MRLSDLLRSSDEDSSWDPKRKRLVQFFIGLSLIGIVIFIFTLWAFVPRKQGSPPESEIVSDLIRLREEAEDLKKQVELSKRSSPSAFALNEKERPRRTIQQVYDYDPGDGFLSITPEEERPYIPTGSVFLAQLITPIKTSVERTFVIAETTREFRMDMKRRIPKGSRLIGRSRLNPILKGVIVEFEMLVLPNGIETPLIALALSRNALPEIDGLYFSNDLETYGAALAFGFLSGFAAGAREYEPSIYGSQPQVNLRNQVLGGLSTASFQVAEDILRDVQRRAIEYVVVPAGERIFVALTRRYEIVPEAMENR